MTKEFVETNVFITKAAEERKMASKSMLSEGLPKFKL